MTLARMLLQGLLYIAAMSSLAAAPSDSVYLLETPLTTQDGRPAHLDLNRGHPTLITMFYASCPHVCPTLIASMRRMEHQLDESRRARLRILLVSLDPDRDTPAALRELAERHGVDTTRWTFAQTPKAEVRKLAAVLGIQYRQLPDGEFNHSTVITLLDAQGRIVTRTSGITHADADFLQLLQLATTAAGD